MPLAELKITSALGGNRSCRMSIGPDAFRPPNRVMSETELALRQPRDSSSTSKPAAPLLIAASIRRHRRSASARSPGRNASDHSPDRNAFARSRDPHYA